MHFSNLRHALADNVESVLSQSRPATFFSGLQSSLALCNGIITVIKCRWLKLPSSCQAISTYCVTPGSPTHQSRRYGSRTLEGCHSLAGLFSLLHAIWLFSRYGFSANQGHEGFSELFRGRQRRFLHSRTALQNWAPLHGLVLLPSLNSQTLFGSFPRSLHGTWARAEKRLRVQAMVFCIFASFRL